MTLLEYLHLLLIVWLALAIPAAVLVGRALRRADVANSDADTDLLFIPEAWLR